MSKNTEKPRKWKKITKKTEPWKKPIKILKKLASSVQFWFYKPKTEKPNRIEPNPKKKTSQTGKKPSQTKKNRAKPVWTGFFPKKPNQNRFKSVWVGFLTKTGQFEPVSVFKKKFSLVIFFDKNQTEPKIITLVIRS